MVARTARMARTGELSGMRFTALSELARDRAGVTSMEYAVLFVAIVVGGLSLWLSFGQALAGLFG
jgi:Flp pilus assembly pilin Flp